MVQVPFTGVSTQRKVQLTLTDTQERLLDRMLVNCGETPVDLKEEECVVPRAARESRRRQFIAGRKNVELDEEMSNTLRQYKSSLANQQMINFKEKLPCFTMKAELLNAIIKNQVVVVSGETGCGKTTQVPQFILDHAVLQGRGSCVSVVVTQPRRVAAISVAERVAAERREQLGGSVGYQVRLDHKLPREAGGILYCTTGILLQRMQSDRSLKQFTHVILDEIHERDVLADVIMVILRQVLPERPDLRVVLMSATLNAAMFSDYFNNCPVVHVPGFMFPVTAYYLEEVLQMIDFTIVDAIEDDRGNVKKAETRVLTQEIVDKLQIDLKLSQRTADNLMHPMAESLNLDLVATLVSHIHETEPVGAILVFLPGWEDISSLAGLLSSSFHLSNALVLPLHGSMSPADQKLIFDRPREGVRKIVIATNIAESSITIDDVVYVVDSGKAKIKMFDPNRNFATLQPEWISKANAKQRAGRAGRIQPGKVFKLFSRTRDESLADYMAPEMVRSRLENVILKINVLGYVDVPQFLSELMDPPSQASVNISNQALVDIGALDKLANLTSLGWSLGQLPLDPQLGKMMILGAAFCCLDPVLSVVTSLDAKSPFHVTVHKGKDAAGAVDRLAANTVSDHLAVANAVAAWDGLNSRHNSSRRNEAASDFCFKNFLSQRVLNTMDRVKYQYSKELFKLGLCPSTDAKDPCCNINSHREAVVRAVITTGLLPNVATIQEKENEHTMVTARGQSLEFHPRSTNRDILTKVKRSSQWQSSIPRWFTYFEKMHSSDTFLHDSTASSPLSLLILATNISFRLHPDPYADPSLDAGTKRTLGCLFPDPDLRIFNVLVTAGKTGLRLFICSEETVGKVKRIRAAVEKALKAKFVDNSQKWDTTNREGRILQGLITLLEKDVDVAM